MQLDVLLSQVFNERSTLLSSLSKVQCHVVVFGVQDI